MLGADITKLFFGKCSEYSEECKAILDQLGDTFTEDVKKQIEESVGKELRWKGRPSTRRCFLKKVQDVIKTNYARISWKFRLSGSQSQRYRKLILREVVTGKGKFEDKEAVADSILKWNDSERPDATKSSFELLDDKWFNDHVGANETKLAFRSRGGTRGLALRIEDLVSSIDKSLRK